MERAFYKNTIKGFIDEDDKSIQGILTLKFSNRTLEHQQKNAWLVQIAILKDQLKGFKGFIYFEFAIPRMGKRVDNVVIVGDKVFVLEFKVGSKTYDKASEDQVLDYCLDLQNFHEGSHNVDLIPILIATEAKKTILEVNEFSGFKNSIKCNKLTIRTVIDRYKTFEEFDILKWENSKYKPTPTIVEAAQALYAGHQVEDISRNDAKEENLSVTANYIDRIISETKKKGQKSILFVTGVPGAGKTLAGLSVVNNRKDIDIEGKTVFLSGNGPLVEVLREALARDKYLQSKRINKPIKKAEAERQVKQFIQPIHNFRNEYLKDLGIPNEKVAVFDEAQRAWDKSQTIAFMQKRGELLFDKSEPDFLISIMDRHADWSTIVCLVGGGQELNKGEAGLSEWLDALKLNHNHWKVYYSSAIQSDDTYLRKDEYKQWLSKNAISKSELHLAVSIRSFRTEKQALFVRQLLDIDNEAALTLKQLIEDFPIVLTRELTIAKKWLKNKAQANERIGIISSSGARRLKPFGIDVKNEISPPNWFLNDKYDVRSSNYLEDVATEFKIQGLEIDWACLAWGANFHFDNEGWSYQRFQGTKWQQMHQEMDRLYLKNAYRVLLTRARQGIVIFIPKGNEEDATRPNEFYDSTYNYLLEVGIKEI